LIEKVSSGIVHLERRWIMPLEIGKKYGFLTILSSVKAELAKDCRFKQKNKE
jgi:hypothetical protein